MHEIVKYIIKIMKIKFTVNKIQKITSINVGHKCHYQIQLIRLQCLV